MPGVPDRNEVEGKLKQGVGAVEESAGHATGNEELAAEGQARQDEGKAQAALGKASKAVGETVKNLKHKLGG
jgi:uncharacterized protein YjbJ (UPF0337 family)